MYDKKIYQLVIVYGARGLHTEEIFIKILNVV